MADEKLNRAERRAKRFGNKASLKKKFFNDVLESGLSKKCGESTKWTK